MIRLLLFLLITFSSSLSASSSVRLKDLADFDGVRGNDLVGYGLVVGLNGTGDGIRNSPFTEEMMSSILERLGINVSGEQFRPKNVAAVLVTAALPPFSRIGGQLDVTVSTIGDASSLLGGTLIMTPLSGADGKIYAVAQGSVLAGGVGGEGDGGRVVHGVPTAGSIISGARVEQEIDFELNSLETLRLVLRDPDFSTAGIVEEAINGFFSKQVAIMKDSRTIDIDISKLAVPTLAHAIGQIENIRILPERSAKVVVDQKSGTIVIGKEVTISSVAVAQGALTLAIEEAPLVVQPSPFSDGQTIVIPRTNARVEKNSGNGIILLPEATTLSQVVSGLNALGVTPLDMIDILKNIKAAGAINAEFIIR